jgi:hypothetical protein
MEKSINASDRGAAAIPHAGPEVGEEESDDGSSTPLNRSPGPPPTGDDPPGRSASAGASTLDAPLPANAARARGPLLPVVSRPRLPESAATPGSVPLAAVRPSVADAAATPRPAVPSAAMRPRVSDAEGPLGTAVEAAGGPRVSGAESPPGAAVEAAGARAAVLSLRISVPQTPTPSHAHAGAGRAGADRRATSRRPSRSAPTSKQPVVKSTERFPEIVDPTRNDDKLVAARAAAVAALAKYEEACRAARQEKRLLAIAKAKRPRPSTSLVSANYDSDNESDEAADKGQELGHNHERGCKQNGRPTQELPSQKPSRQPDDETPRNSSDSSGVENGAARLEREEDKDEKGWESVQPSNSGAGRSAKWRGLAFCMRKCENHRHRTSRDEIRACRRLKNGCRLSVFAKAALKARRLGSQTPRGTTSDDETANPHAAAQIAVTTNRCS